MKKWWKAAGIRALKTFAQTLVASISIGAAMADINWISVLSVAGVAAICSLCTSIAGLPELESEEKEV
ncbi:MAG: hypothetical protein II453_12430 [Alphaproteobacteria bacterium]|nr:hypothetical protein [Alphaproteobacteria bacterium]